MLYGFLSQSRRIRLAKRQNWIRDENRIVFLRMCTVALLDGSACGLIRGRTEDGETVKGKASEKDVCDA